MNKRFQKGSSTSEGLWILAALSIIIFLFILPDGGTYLTSPGSVGQFTQSSISGQESSARQTTTGPSLSTNPNSSYSKHVSLGRGNASYAYQSYEEYVTISNRGRASIDITGWRLSNGKGERPYDYGGMLRYFPSDSVSIPQASLYLDPNGSRLSQNVVLGSGETAIITTGSMGATIPYRITSFKENICSGYLESMPEYAFTPPLSRNCPSPSKEAGLENLEPKCRDFIKRMNSCRVPDFNTSDIKNETCNSCVDGVRLSNSCVAFIKERFNYAGCIAYHKDAPDFSGRTWRIFLGQGWEMYAKNYETISLFDRIGNLVDSISY